MSNIFIGMKLGVLAIALLVSLIPRPAGAVRGVAWPRSVFNYKAYY